MRSLGMESATPSQMRATGRAAKIIGPVLFYCRTPLQALIIRWLIENEVEGEADVIYHPTSASPKHEAYYRELCTRRKVLVFTRGARFSDTLADAAVILRLPSWTREKYAAIVISSVGAMSANWLVARNKHAQVFTFDDGTFNINRSVYLPWIDSPPRAKVLAQNVLRAASNREVLQRAVAHFTIYPTHLVVGEHKRIYEIELFPPRKGVTRFSGRIRVLLGTWYPEPGAQSAYERIVSRVKCDVFLPHPEDLRPPYMSERARGLIDVETVETKIAEDVVLRLLSRGIEVTVMGFGSTTLYNLGRSVRTINLIHSYSRSPLPRDVSQTLGVRDFRIRD